VAASIRKPTAPDATAPESAHNRRFAPPDSVARVVLQALQSASPLPRYLVGTRWEGERMLDALITRLIDAATSPGQALDEAALVQRLRQAWRR
jgi:hypothetical protein